MSKPEEEVLISVPIEAKAILEMAARLYRKRTYPQLLETLTLHIGKLESLFVSGEMGRKQTRIHQLQSRNTGQSNNPEELWDAIEKMESNE